MGKTPGLQVFVFELGGFWPRRTRVAARVYHSSRRIAAEVRRGTYVGPTAFPGILSCDSDSHVRLHQRWLGRRGRRLRISNFQLQRPNFDFPEFRTCAYQLPHVGFWSWEFHFRKSEVEMQPPEDGRLKSKFTFRKLEV